MLDVPGDEPILVVLFDLLQAHERLDERLIGHGDVSFPELLACGEGLSPLGSAHQVLSALFLVVYRSSYLALGSHLAGRKAPGGDLGLNFDPGSCESFLKTQDPKD